MSRAASAKAALDRVRRRLERALEPDHVPLTIPEAAALVGVSREWMGRRLTRLQRDGHGVLWDGRREGARLPQWKTTPRMVRLALASREDVAPTREEAADDLEALRARVHRLEVLQGIHTERLAELATVG